MCLGFALLFIVICLCDEGALNEHLPTTIIERTLDILNLALLWPFLVGIHMVPSSKELSSWLVLLLLILNVFYGWCLFEVFLAVTKTLNRKLRPATSSDTPTRENQVSGSL
jgi:hypothetical protein